MTPVQVERNLAALEAIADARTLSGIWHAGLTEAHAAVGTLARVWGHVDLRRGLVAMCRLAFQREGALQKVPGEELTPAMVLAHLEKLRTAQVTHLYAELQRAANEQNPQLLLEAQAEGEQVLQALDKAMDAVARRL